MTLSCHTFTGMQRPMTARMHAFYLIDFNQRTDLCHHQDLCCHLQCNVEQASKYVVLTVEERCRITGLLLATNTN
jgi:hypothetical protein